MVHPSSGAASATVNHIVPLGTNEGNACVGHAKDGESQHQPGEASRQADVPSDDEAPFSTNVVWDREPSINQGNSSVWNQDDERMDGPSVNLPFAYPSVAVARSHSPSEPAEDEDVSMEAEVVRQPQASERFAIPARVPTGAADRAQLVRVFREAIIQGQIRGMLRRDNVEIGQLRVSAHSIRHIQLDVALRNNGRVNGKLYLLPENITRHDWNCRTGECFYSVNLVDPPIRSTAEQLETVFSGVPYTIWEYWGRRTRVREVHVHRYVYGNFGRYGFYRVVMWFWLNGRNWLELWRRLQSSGRV